MIGREIQGILLLWYDMIRRGSKLLERALSLIFHYKLLICFDFFGASKRRRKKVCVFVPISIGVFKFFLWLKEEDDGFLCTYCMHDKAQCSKQN